MFRRKLKATVVAVLTLIAVIALAMQSSAAGAAAGPAFVQQVSAHAGTVASLSATPAAAVATGDRMVVLVGIWSSGGPTAKTVSDSAGNAYTEVLHFKASDGTEMSVWTAPITAGGGTRPAITVTPTATADIGVAASEYAGLSSAAGAAAVDQTSHATATTSAKGTVTSGATSPTSGQNELAIGMYVDSGFGGTITSGTGYTQRSNISGASNIDLLTEDQALAASGATPSASAGTSASTIWLMATVVFQGASAGSPTAPAAPANVSATAGDATATVTWTAPGNGGSQITAYTVTPYIGASPQTATTVTGSPPATTATITGLTDGTAYTFTVAATNAIGQGPASAPSNSVTPSAASGGQWSSLMNWPMVAIHSILMDNGKFLQFDGWQQPEPTQVWDPATQTFTTQTAPDSIFCSAMAELPDGRVLVVGGYGGLSIGQLGIPDTTIFDPSTNTWTRVADMHSARWYPDLTELADGRFVAISGNTTDESHWADTPEVFDPATGQWTALTGVSTSQVHEQEYPFSYLLPNGNVFTIGPAEDKSFELNVGAKTWTQVGGSSGVTLGSSVMYRPGKILYSGGAADLDSTTPAQSTAAVIDATAPTPAWRPVASMTRARMYHTLTMLADGRVLAVGGEPTAGQTGPSEVSGGVLPSEIWDPTTETWSPAAALSTTRGYHSTAVLMPDGRVLVAGSGHANPGYAGQNSAQIYSPPYLFKSARPTISSAPAFMTYGSNFTVSTPDAASISSVNLVSLGADTHQIDMDQHFVPLGFTAGAGSLTIQAPASGTYAPPGHYMLFIVNSDGVPSVAPIMQVGGPVTVPSAPTGVAAQPGDGRATVSWTAPASDGGSPITSYTVTPYIGSAAQTSTTVTGTPPATGTTVTGLTDGTTYTFTVTATNAAGTGPASAASAPVTPSADAAPAFVQQASAHSGMTSSLAVTMSSATVAGDRLVVETGIWSAAGATAKSVSDSAGDTFTELTHFTAGDGTEMSVWSAPVSVGGTAPKVTVAATASADVGIAALEYAGLSTASGATVVDQSAHAVGKTGSAGASVTSGATAATTAGSELALGFYADSGFGDTLKAGTGFVQRANISNVGDMELLAEDQIVSAGATPNASVSTGASTYWLMATVVLKAAAPPSGQSSSTQAATLVEAPPAAQFAIAAPAARFAIAAPAVSFTAAAPATLFTAVPVPVSGAGSAERPALARAALGCAAAGSHGADSACRSVRRAAAVTRRDRWRFVYEALLENLSPALLCHHSRTRSVQGLLGLSAGWYANT